MELNQLPMKSRDLMDSRRSVELAKLHKDSRVWLSVEKRHYCTGQSESNQPPL